MNMDLYNEKIDYKEKHLTWVKAHPRFLPRLGLVDPRRSYLEELKITYEGVKYNYTAFQFFYLDYNYFISGKNINTEAAELFGMNTNNKYFITWNFNDENFDLQKIIPHLQSLLERDWILKFTGVFEYYGEDNNHPHLHSIIEVKNEFNLKKFRKYILQQSISKLIKSNFVDIKKYINTHTDYLDGIKTDSKMENVEKDKIWRKKLGLQDEYIK